MIADTLSKNPVFAIITTVGTSAINWFEIINPLLSMVSLLIGISVGLTTLYLQLKKIRNK